MGSAAELRIGFVTSSLMYRDSSGRVFTNTGLGRLVEAVAGRVARFSLASSVMAQRQDQHEHALALKPTNIRFLPSMPSIAQGAFRGRECDRVVREIEDRSDVVIVQLPFSAPSALFAARRPRVYHFCSDVRAVVAASQYYRGPKYYAARAAAFVFDCIQADLAHGARAGALTNGQALYDHYRPSRGRSIVSSTLKKEEIASVTRKRPAGRWRLLFVGMLRPEKGIDVLLDAFETLDHDVELVVVGGVDAVEMGAARDLYARLARYSGDRVSFAGHLPFGPALFQAFADADVLVVPSLSEGTPRVLVEARAFGCPVIATRVGGIPSSVEDEVDGLLIEPNNPMALAAAVRRLRADPPLRDRLIQNGYLRARRTTVDAQAEALLDVACEVACL